MNMAHVRKMLLLFFIVFLYTVLSEETDLDEFFVVSTSQRPSETQSVADRLKLEFKLDKLVIDKLETMLEDRLELFQKELVDLKQSKVLLEQQLEKAKKGINELESAKTLLETQLRNQSLHIQEQNNLLEKNSKKLKNLQEQVIGYNLPKDCKEIRQNDFKFSGVYRIKPESSIKSFEVWCDMETRGGAWIYFLNRFDGSLDFNLNWAEYKQGFGDLRGELWLGLENLYQLTGTQTKELLIELVDWDMKKVYAYYKKFSIGSEEEGYYLKTIDEYNGDAGPCFRGHLGNKFSTEDRDQDTWANNCAKEWGAGWWFDACYWSIFTGKYHNETSFAKITSGNSGIKCDTFHGFSYSLKEVRMMIR